MTASDNEIVIDASLALAWCFPDEGSDYADRVLVALHDGTILVPAIWSLEITNALLVGGRRNRIRSQEVRRFVELLKALNIQEETQPFAETIGNILPIAREHNLSAYDAAYLDLAVRHGAPLATLDAALQKAARNANSKIFRP